MNMIDMRPTIIVKSDQLNADDLIGSAITIKITGVKVVSNDQPVSVSYEGDQGKPYKPCKSMCKVMVAIWGEDGNNYIGQSMTLFLDPTVKWAGKEVGGIRISHMTGLNEVRVMSLTATRGNKKPYKIMPLISQPPTNEGFPISDDDWSTWCSKMDSAQTVEEITIIGKQIGEVSDKYDLESTGKLKSYYADRLTSIKNPECGGS